MAAVSQNILDVEHFKVDFFRTSLPTGRLLFTFTEFSNRQLDGTGFGGQFALDNGYDLVAFKTDLDDWYHSLPEDIFDRIELFLKSIPDRHDWRATYGSSMGGYAAILFAQSLKADVALALSPQFDITQDWDRRWAAHTSKISSMRRLTSEMIRPECCYYIVYDPADPDIQHFKQFSRVFAGRNLRQIRVFHAGHPVGYFLKAIGSLKELTRVLSGDEPPDILGNARRNRSHYPDYLFQLAGHCLQRGKLKWAKSLILQSLAKSPLNSEYNMRAAIILNACEELDGAISHAALAVAVSPKHPHMNAALAGFLHKKGLNKQALNYLDVAIALIPNDAGLRQQRVSINLLVEGKG